MFVVGELVPGRLGVDSFFCDGFVVEEGGVFGVVGGVEVGVLGEEVLGVVEVELLLVLEELLDDLCGEGPHL